MDLTATIIPKSDQLNAEDLLTGPVTVTIESVSAGNAEQPVDVHLVEYPGRAYRPSKTMRRVLVKIWGKESEAYTGRRMTLYRDPEVKFGGQKVGGIKISHLSHTDKEVSLALTETKGKRALHTVKPLTDVAPSKTTKASAPTGRIPELLAAFDAAHVPNPDRAAFIAETIGHTATPATMTDADITAVIDALKAMVPAPAPDAPPAKSQAEIDAEWNLAQDGQPDA